jgi:hypothetical protein
MFCVYVGGYYLIQTTPTKFGQEGFPYQTNLREPISEIMQTLKEFSIEQGFTGVIPAVRTNANGYPYLVFIKGDTTECIYFSKTLAASLAAGQVLGKADFSEMRARLVTNAAGESRYKICSVGDSPVVSTADLF